MGIPDSIHNNLKAENEKLKLRIKVLCRNRANISDQNVRNYTKCKELEADPADIKLELSTPETVGMEKLCKTCNHYNRPGQHAGCCKLHEWVHAWSPHKFPDWINIRILGIFEPPEYWYCKEWKGNNNE